LIPSGCTAPGPARSSKYPRIVEELVPWRAWLGLPLVRDTLLRLSCDPSPLKPPLWLQLLVAWAVLASPITASAAGPPPDGKAWPLSGYRPLQIDNLTSLRNPDPRLLVIRAFGHRDSAHPEGLQQERIVITYATPQALALLELIGMADDSVRSRRYSFVLALDGGSWRVVRAGSQWICQPGRGHQNWAATPCR